ncbi:MAG TPA: hypothetical protein VK689_09865 [Armatimonadota bacterium]|nr:hypothetical protein [Armatimonadota bacterium]
MQPGYSSHRPGRNAACAILILGALLFGSPVGAASLTEALDGEPRLDKTIDLAMKDEPLADLLARVAKETGAPLKASPEVADERVTLFARSRPAREVLAVVAEHFDYSWVRGTSQGVERLTLYQDLAARQREQALRARTGGGIEALRESLEEQIRQRNSPEAQELARKTPEERHRRLDELEERLRGRVVVERRMEGGSLVTHYNRVPVQPEPTKAEREALQREEQLLYQLSPERYTHFVETDAASRVYSILPPEGREALWRGEAVRFAYPSERNRIPLSHRMAVDLVSGALGHLAHREDPAGGRDIPVPFQSVERLRGELYVEGTGADAELQIRVRTLGSFGDSGGITRVEQVFKTSPSFPDPNPRQSGPRLDEAAKALRQPITLPAASLPSGKKSETPFADLLERIAAQIAYPVIADGYWSGAVKAAFESKGQPLAEVLDWASSQYDRTCRFRRGYLLLRHQDWAVRRAMEPPARAVRRWSASIRRHGVLPFQDLVEIGGSLTPEQTEVLRDRWNDRIPRTVYWLLASLEFTRPLLRVVHALPPGLRKTLDAGQPIPFRHLPPNVLAHVRRALIGALERTGGYDNRPSLDGRPFVPGQGFVEEDRVEAAWDKGVLRLERTPRIWLDTQDQYYALEELDVALAVERTRNPKITARDLKRIDGEAVEICLEVPGAEPIRTAFVSPRSERKER